MQWPPSLLAKSPRQVWMAAACSAAAVLLIALLIARPALTAWFALALAIPAVVMAYLALVKARMLEFCPEVFAGDVILPRSGRPLDGTRLLLPLQFTNSG